MPATLEYEIASHKYVWSSGDDEGDYVNNASVRSLVYDNIERLKEEATILAQDLFEDSISLSDWEIGLALLLKTLTMQSYAIGKPTELTFADYARISKDLKFQYAKLRNFARLIQRGILSQAQIQARQNLYLNKSWEAYEQSRRQIHKETGWRWEKREKPALESCLECITYHNLKWQRLGTLPRPTEKCRCMANCKCYFVYSKAQLRPTSQSTQFLKTTYGWIA